MCEPLHRPKNPDATAETLRAVMGSVTLSGPAPSGKFLNQPDTELAEFGPWLAVSDASDSSWHDVAAEMWVSLMGTTQSRSIESVAELKRENARLNAILVADWKRRDLLEELLACALDCRYHVSQPHACETDRDGYCAGWRIAEQKYNAVLDVLSVHGKDES